MKKLFFLLILTGFSLLSVSNAQTSKFGIGIILGEPTGLSAKAWLSSNTAVDAALAWSFIDEGALHLHADYLFHEFSLLNVSSGKLPFYFGIGGRLKFSNDMQIGVRVPFGLSYLPANTPLDIFVEVVPIMDLAPETKFKFNGALGIRFYL